MYRAVLPATILPVLQAPRDPILGVTEAFLADRNPDKINLGVVRTHPVQQPQHTISTWAHSTHSAAHAAHTAQHLAALAAHTTCLQHPQHTQRTAFSHALHAAHTTCLQHPQHTQRTAFWPSSACGTQPAPAAHAAYTAHSIWPPANWPEAARAAHSTCLRDTQGTQRTASAGEHRWLHTWGKSIHYERSRQQSVVLPACPTCLVSVINCLWRFRPCKPI
jgi:hypothetical protein